MAGTWAPVCHRPYPSLRLPRCTLSLACQALKAVEIFRQELCQDTNR